MDFFTASIRAAFELITANDPDISSAVTVSVTISLWSTLFASVIGIPAGLAVGAFEFPGKRMVLTLLNTLMALPTVVVGLGVYGILSRQGPLGEMGLLFTPLAMVIGQTLLAIPIITNNTVSAVTGANQSILPTARTLGAGPIQSMIILISEVRFGIMAAVIAGLGRIIAEVGIAMMLGGNIRGYTRTMTTAIALETSKGEFTFGLAIGIILMTIALLINLFLNTLQQR